MKRAPLLLAALVAMVLASCDGNAFFDQQRTVDEHGWCPADSVAFTVEVDDTNQLFDFLVEVRNSVDYPYANTFLFLRTEFPDGGQSTDTLEYPLATPEGRWLGRRTGRYVDTRFPLRRNARFPMSGQYRFCFTNGMRDSAVAGLKNIGFRIEYSNMK